jgi:hypothetical protein
MAGAPAVVGSVAQQRALGGLTAASALDRRGVDEQQIVLAPWALAREDAQQPFDRVREPSAALDISGLGGQLRKQVREALPGDRDEPTIARDSHDRLGDTERDDLRVCDSSPGVPRPLGQEIVRRAINGAPVHPVVKMTLSDHDVPAHGLVSATSLGDGSCASRGGRRCPAEPA